MTKQFEPSPERFIPRKQHAEKPPETPDDNEGRIKKKMERAAEFTFPTSERQLLETWIINHNQPISSRTMISYGISNYQKLVNMNALLRQAGLRIRTTTVGQGWENSSYRLEQV